MIKKVLLLCLVLAGCAGDTSYPLVSGGSHSFKNDTGKLTLINFNSMQSAEVFVHITRLELTRLAGIMEMGVQGEWTKQEQSFWHRWTRAYPMHEQSEEVKTLLRNITLIAHFLRLFDFGYITYDNKREGSIYADQQLCCWMSPWRE